MKFKLIITEKITQEEITCEVVAPTLEIARLIFDKALAGDFNLQSISHIKSIVQMDIAPICPN